jgi:aryl-alcohol dehydrogenase-like predicted oxidoreductase
MVPQTSLPRSGLMISRLALGLSRLHYLGSDAARRKLIDAALDMGITHFDTARLYGDGLAERALGDALANRRASVTIGTKFGLLPSDLIERLGRLGFPIRAGRAVVRRLGYMNQPPRSWTPAAMKASLAASLRALRTDYVDIFFLHSPTADELTHGGDDLFAALETEKDKGTINFLGLSASPTDCQTILHRFGHLIDVIQMPETEWTEDRIIPDLTFGALHAGPQRFGARGLSEENVCRRLTYALARRSRGSVIVSTTRMHHLVQLASLTAQT